MDTLQQINDLAKQIIVTTCGNTKVQTWDQQGSAPAGGYTDRAGYVLYDSIESYADVAITDQNDAVLRARIAKVTGEGEDERFYIVTLDFHADIDSIKQIIDQRSAMSANVLIDVLKQQNTTPKLLQVSFTTGQKESTEPNSVRYEYPENEFASLTLQDQQKFIDTVKLTFQTITK